METPQVHDIRSALNRHKPRRIPLTRQMRRAAVAATLRDSSRGAELLFIRRAEHDSDPWSGHMAFPGGRVDRTDASPLAAAKREAREEVNLDLDVHGQLVGRLSDLTAMAHGKPLPMIVVPFVFELGVDSSRTSELGLKAEENEVAEMVWVPVSFLLDHGNREKMSWRYFGADIKLPCYHWEGRRIWGLTLRMVDELLGALGGLNTGFASA